MDPQQDHTPGLGMSQPTVEKEASPYMLHGTVSDGQQGQDASSPPAPAQAAPPMTTTSLSVDDQVETSSVVADDDADNTELDEEWVDKAKGIVGRTHADPFLQSNELAKVKADYLKVRYNKDVKVAEDQKQ